MLILFKILLALGPISAVLFFIEVQRGTMKRVTLWKDLTRYQWFIAAGLVVCFPIGFLGLIIFGK